MLSIILIFTFYVVQIFSLQLPVLEKILAREYASFFKPMDVSAYCDDVSFTDPMISITGVANYQKNVDMLGGRTMLGNILFKDSSITLHNIKSEGNKITTRWTLRTTVQAIPWKPTARFSGISEYTLDEDGKIKAQVDYWDSINLKAGKYQQVSKLEGIQDFLSQLKDETKGSAELAAPELPYELLRRAARYEVRRYPALAVAETSYAQRPEGYDRLGSYAGGSNEKSKKVNIYSPTIMNIIQDGESRTKQMYWPLAYQFPGETIDLASFPASTIRGVKILPKESITVGVVRFEMPATEPIARGYMKRLIEDLEGDGIECSPGSKSGDICLAQFDALFSLNKRRNEVWVPLIDHPWK